MNKKRVLGLDIVRCVAIWFVISVHFFVNSDFYVTEVNGAGMYVLSIFRWLFFTCIALFLLLTGYLNDNTKFDRKYFYKLFKVLFSYVIVAVVSLIFKSIYLDSDISFVSGVISIFDFSATGYTWYVEMYVGLFLLIPFLNGLYKHLRTKENRVKLILVLLVMFALPVTLKLFYPPRYTIDIFSDYWLVAYPLLYFFIGKFLKDYPLQVNSKKMVLGLVLLLVIQSGIVFISYHNQTYLNDKLGGYVGGYYNIFTVLEAILLFSLLLRINLKNKICTRVITSVSLVSFEMYLISSPIDTFIYNEMNYSFNSVLDYMVNYLISMVIILPLAFCLAFIINRVSTFIYKKFRPLYDKLMMVLSNNFGKIWKRIVN